MALTTKEFSDRIPPARWIAVAAAVALVVIVFVAAQSCTGQDTTSTVSDPGNSSSAPAGPKGSVLPQIPNLHHTSHDPDWLTAAPTHISWQRVDGIPFPFSGSDGPTRIEGAVTSGYSHTPQGAVLAAAHITFRLAWSPDFQAVLDEQTKVSQTTREQLVSARSHSGTVDPAMVAAVAKAPVAFKIAGYTPARADVYLAFPGADGGYRFAPVVVVWDGDWKYSDDVAIPELPDSANLDGFTTWEAEKR